MNAKFGCRHVLWFGSVGKPEWTFSEPCTSELPTCMWFAAGLAANAAGAVAAWHGIAWLLERNPNCIVNFFFFVCRKCWLVGNFCGSRFWPTGYTERVHEMCMDILILHWLTDWLIDCWLIDWLIDWLINLLISQLVWMFWSINSEFSYFSNQNQKADMDRFSEIF